MLKENNIPLSKIKNIFLDRDGVINRRKIGGYILNKAEFELLDGVLEKLKSWSIKGKRLFIITNQKGVGKGLMTENDLENLHQHMLAIFAENNIRIEDIKYCTALSDNDFRRKPNPGMLLEIFDEFQFVKPSETLFIGDSLSDLQAGKAVGTYTCFLHNNLELSDQIRQNADLIFESLLKTEIPF